MFTQPAAPGAHLMAQLLLPDGATGRWTGSGSSVRRCQLRSVTAAVPYSPLAQPSRVTLSRSVFIDWLYAACDIIRQVLACWHNSAFRLDSIHHMQTETNYGRFTGPED